MRRLTLWFPAADVAGKGPGFRFLNPHMWVMRTRAHAANHAYVGCMKRACTICSADRERETSAQLPLPQTAAVSDGFRTLLCFGVRVLPALCSQGSQCCGMDLDEIEFVTGMLPMSACIVHVCMLKCSQASQCCSMGLGEIEFVTGVCGRLHGWCVLVSPVCPYGWMCANMLAACPHAAVLQCPLSCCGIPCIALGLLHTFPTQPPASCYGRGYAGLSAPLLVGIDESGAGSWIARPEAAAC